MQISDMLGQYNRNVTAGTENLTGVKGVEQLVSSLKELKIGNIFEGTINSMKNGQVTLGLSNGQTILARLDGKINLNVGESMFFQVKMNDGAQIAIRPFSGGGIAGNPTLLNALFAAGLPANEKNLNMVNSMMQDQMSIDKQSLNDMMKAVLSNENVDVKTIVQMTKLNLPISEEMAAQFENYQNDSHTIVNEINTMIDELPQIMEQEILSQKQIVDLNHGILQVIQGDTRAEEQSAPNGMTQGQILPDEAEQKFAATVTDQGIIKEQSAEAAEQLPKVHDMSAYPKNTIGNLLTGTQIENLTKQLADIPETALNEQLFSQQTDGEEIVQQLKLDLPVHSFLKALDESLTKALQDGTLSNQTVFDDQVGGNAGKLLGGKEYQTLLKNVLGQQWLLKPESLKSKNKISELYERLSDQMEKLENVLKDAGIARSSITETTTDIRSNIEFMNQVNQTYTYVQIPLKMSGQNANGDLYVYTNKKNLSDPESELTAFLHLDLNNLGATDVSIKMRPKTKEVATNFYLDDDASYQLIRQNMPILEDRLTRKGYHCTISVSKGENHVNFVDDFLKRDQKSAGTLHRYSFDVRA